MSCLDAALLYASLGWYVLPVHSVNNGQCTCGKQTCPSPGKHPLTKHGLSDASIEPDTIADWFKRWPWANVGILTGEKSGIVTLDIDPRHLGDDTLKDLESKQGKLPDTIESLTGGGGRHLLFKHPNCGWISGGANALGPGIDTRADGGFIVAPPSLHATGNLYAWEVSSEPPHIKLADLPNWITAIVASTNGSKPKAPPNKTSTTQKLVQSGGRNSALTSMAGAMRRKGMPAAAIEAALLETNREICDPPLTDSEVIKIAQSVGRYTPQAVPTDDELADEWIKKFPDTKYGLGDFRRYANGIWPVVSLNQVGAEVLDLLEAAKIKGYKPTSWKVDSVRKLAMLKCSVPNELWNSDHNLLACHNGTLFIPKRTLQTHKKENYLTSGVAYDFHPLARDDIWNDFLSETIPDASAFLQEYSGYCLTTDTSYETAIWLYGPTGSGKSTFIAGLQAMLGERTGILGLADLERSRFALTNLPDKTLLVSTEQPATYITAAHILNAMISGEPVTIDRKFREPVTLIPHAKMLWAMNDLPRISEAGSGLFRRVKVVEFPPLSVPPDPQVKESIKQIGAGILNWALDGLLRLRARGSFLIPPCVRDATDQFKSFNDIPQLFVEDRCKTGNFTFEVKSSILYNAYREWCMDNGHKPQSSTTLAMDWKRLGFTKERRADGIYWIGVTLKP